MTSKQFHSIQFMFLFGFSTIAECLSTTSVWALTGKFSLFLFTAIEFIAWASIRNQYK